MLPVLPLEGYPVHADDAFFQAVPGAGGYGHPFERSISDVRDDTLDGKITNDYAREVYGVVLKGNEVDEPATEALRAERTERAPDHVALFWREFATMVPGGLAPPVSTA